MLAVFDPFIEKWLALSKRDQQAALALGISLIIAIIVFGVIVPISSMHSKARQDFETASATLTELTNLAPQAMSAGQAGSSNKSGNSLISDIRRQAARNGLVLQGFDPDGDFLKISLENVQYSSVVQWLGGLEATGVEHMDLAMEDRPKPGLVSVRVTLGYRQ